MKSLNEFYINLNTFHNNYKLTKLTQKQRDVIELEYRKLENEMKLRRYLLSAFGNKIIRLST